MSSGFIYVGPREGLPNNLGDHIGLVFTGFLIVWAVVFNILEANPKTELSYSKFALRGGKDKLWQISSSIGMPLLYAPACLFALYSAKYSSEGSQRVQLVNFLVAAHFAKRVLETLYVHVYSATMAVKDVATISVGYTFMAWLSHIGTLYCYRENSEFFDSQSKDVAIAGVILFLIGSAGNLHHHYIMASWRKGKPEKEKKKYIVPSGGLFKYVSCPHYMFEIVAWIGVGIAGSNLFAFFHAASAIVYLAPKSVKTTGWYRQKIEDYPKDRKHLIPYIF
ncbi:hypothetical protein HDU67_007577 [Dinochytrium kinnereticum]|nr:hypothetical protein HDU67_007577 [Dinochytrium kinnereticum]